MAKDLIIRDNGLALVVCSSLALDETVRRVRAEHPSGTSNGWSLADDAQPVACERYPETHKHYLFDC